MESRSIIDPNQLDTLDNDALRSLVTQLLERIDRDTREIGWRDAKIDKLSFEIAQLRRLRFGRQSEQMAGPQKALFDEAVDADLAALEQQLQDLRKATGKPDAIRQAPRRNPLPAHFPRIEHRHEPDITICTCGCALRRIGEDISEKLDYRPGDFSVHRHIRGKWVCGHCQTLTQAPVPAEVIDKGIPTAGLLAHVLVAKHSDHLPLYRQEAIFGRAGLAIARSTLASWVGICGLRLQPLVALLKTQLLASAVLHADETPVAMLAPGTGKTHRSYLWAYTSGEQEALRAVVYDFTPSRAGEHARAFLGDWRGHLVCDDYSGYKASFERGIIEVGCMAHARRKFVELHLANKSTLAAAAIDLIGQLYQVESDIRRLSPQQRLEHRRSQAAPIAATLHAWLKAQRIKITDGTATAKAIDYSLARWLALTRYLEDPALPIDNNHNERQIRPWATGRKNWLFAGTLLAGQRAATITSLIQSAKLNGRDPYAYLKDVLSRLPTQPNNALHELLPHRWVPAA